MFISNSLTEKELLTDLMTSEKELSTLYNNALIKASDAKTRKVFSQCFSNTQNIQFSIQDAFDIRGWNRTEIINNRDIKIIIKSLKSKDYFSQSKIENR